MYPVCLAVSQLRAELTKNDGFLAVISTAGSVSNRAIPFLPALHLLVQQILCVFQVCVVKSHPIYTYRYPYIFIFCCQSDASGLFKMDIMLIRSSLKEGGRHNIADTLSHETLILCQQTTATVLPAYSCIKVEVPGLRNQRRDHELCLSYFLTIFVL